jgi:hypothetical protein
VFLLEHYWIPKCIAAVHEAFSSIYLDSGVLNKTIHQLVTTFLDVGSVCNGRRFSIGQCWQARCSVLLKKDWHIHF